MVVMAIWMMASCGGKTKQVPFDDGDSADIANADPTIYGVCGEGTAMNTLQLLTDTGDTLSIDLSEAQDKEQVLGGLQVGDRMAVMTNKDKTEAVLVINQLELVMMRESGSGEDETMLYDIVKLGPDSLTLKATDETLEYSRQKPREEYGKDVKLEDSSKEEFKL